MRLINILPRRCAQALHTIVTRAEQCRRQNVDDQMDSDIQRPRMRTTPIIDDLLSVRPNAMIRNCNNKEDRVDQEDCEGRPGADEDPALPASVSIVLAALCWIFEEGIGS